MRLSRIAALLAAAGLCSIAPAARAAELELAETIPLTAAEPGEAETSRKVIGGEFTPEGWKMTDGKDQLVIELAEGFAPGEPGAVELDITNYDPASQGEDEKKQHFLSVYSHEKGSHFHEPTKNLPFVTLRTGTRYSGEEGAGVKLLWKANTKRHEKGGYGSRAWDPNETYTWRVEWTADQLSILVDGEVIFSTDSFDDPALGFGDRNGTLRYVFLGTDNNYRHLSYGMPGPVYKAVRVYRAAK